MGGGGSGGGGNTSQQNQFTNLSPWAQPYVTSMLGAAQSQVFNTNPSGQITGINPYNAFGTSNGQGGQYGLSADDLNAAQSSVAGFSPLQQQSFNSAANLQTPGQFGTATNAATQGTYGSLGTANQARGYGAQGAGYGAASAAYGLGAGSDVANAAQNYAGNINQAGQAFGQMATDPSAVQSYMNPYIQASLQPQLNLLAQQTGINSAAQEAAATQAGAFGGTRSALQNALTQQSGNLAAQQLIGQGYNTAYNTAMQNMQNAAGLGLQGAQGAANTGLQGMTSGANLGIQGLSQGMQGAGLGLQGVGAQQAGYGQGVSGASQLANIGTGQLAANQGIINTQNALGAQQQTNQQNVINQAMQNYQTAMQYPMTQLTNLKNLAMGIPMTDTTTTQTQAAPSAASQLAGLGTAGIAGLGAYNALNK